MKEIPNFEAPKVEAEIPLHFRDVKEFIKISPEAQRVAADTKKALNENRKQELADIGDCLRNV